jgi:hypothetical protein
MHLPASQDMQMQVINRLAAVLPDVRNDPVPAL